MTFKFLGTGTSTGVPVLTCPCRVCQSSDVKDKRLRTSAYMTDGHSHVVIDVGPDFRQQAFAAEIPSLDAVLFTHEHKDHTAGLDDVRPYNYLHGLRDIDLFGKDEVLQQIRHEYHYAFAAAKYPGAPRLICHTIKNESVQIGTLNIQPIEVSHGNLNILGFRINTLAYFTDVSAMSPYAIEQLHGLDYLIINALQIEPHHSHLTLDQAIELAQKIGAKQTYFTHISHKMGRYNDLSPHLPKNIQLAYDGLSFNF